MQHGKLSKAAPAHPNQAGPDLAESRIDQGEKAGVQSLHQQGKGVRGQQGLMQGGSNAAVAQVRTLSFGLQPACVREPRLKVANNTVAT